MSCVCMGMDIGWSRKVYDAWFVNSSLWHKDMNGSLFQDPGLEKK